MSIVMLGSTSGSCTLQEQAVAGTTVLTLPTTSGTVALTSQLPTSPSFVGEIPFSTDGSTYTPTAKIVSGTSVASTSGTSIDFTGIPSWVKRITVMFNGVSTSGTARVMIQLGDSGGIETSGYASGSYYLQSSASNNFLDGPSGFVIYWDEAAGVRYGVMQISLLNASTNLWSQFGNFVIDGSSDGMAICAGTKSLSATLDRIRITTTNGTDTFDAGSINILYE